MKFLTLFSQAMHDATWRVTCWNSTFNMVSFVIEYCPALDIMTADRDMNLHKFESSNREWGMETELCEVLEVCLFLSSFLC